MSSTSTEQTEDLPSPVKNILDPFRDERKGIVREVGNQAIWSLSSCKPGFGVDQLRDNCLDTYWQSDGQLPHLVNIQFRRKTTIKEIYIYTDYKLDESYTPNRISIRAGTNFNDLQEIEVIDLHEPVGWVKIALKDMHDRPIRTFMIQVAVISNHQNGRDTHMRQIKVHSPVDHTGNIMGDFVSVDMLQFTCIR
ncbi:anaphase-promoting complex subunit 10 [Planococcus citri]|uniref:anaphase-promoting complex subunit 10 n=1 Tax=Planococcus citri TaxID=170843 RepID=UPI0031F9782D